MNPLDWEGDIRRLQRNQDQNHQTVDNGIMENASGTDTHWLTYCQYSRYTVEVPQNRLLDVNVGSEGLGPPSHNLYMKESAVEEPDGQPFEIDEEDQELTRKRKELREIEEQIMRKKVSIALKTVQPFVETLSPAILSNKQSETCNGATLKDRVNVILQQRHPAGFLSKVQSPKDRTNSSSLSKDGLLQEDHPLKLRVKELMKQRCSDPCVLPTNRKVLNVTPPPPSRSVTSPAKEENSIDQGFQRFLSVLNKGVDMDLLSRIVNDDSPLGEELLNIQPPAVEDKSDLPIRSESQRSNSGASLPGHSQTNSGERRTDPPSQERSLSDHLPDNDEKKNGRGSLSFGSSSQSTSPPAVKKKRKEEGEKPKVDEQHQQLQNILKTLGLSLEVEEMNKLTNRTQERLYGKKHEGTTADSRREQEIRQRDSHTSHRKSSSCSGSSSSRSTSRSISPSPSRRRRSHSRDSRQSRMSERSGSRDRSRDGPTCQDNNQDSKEGPKNRDRDKDTEDFKETYQHPYPQNQAYPHPAAFAPFPDCSLSQYNAYHSDSYSEATNSYWTSAQGAIPPSIYPSEHPYPQNTYHPFPASVVAPKWVYPRHRILKDINLLENPDLCESEGQLGSFSGPRCLQAISVKQTNTQKCLKQLTKPSKMRRGKIETRKKNRPLRRRRRAAAKRSAQAAVKAEAEAEAEAEEEALQEDEDEHDSEDEQSEEEKQPQTEEEIKANLRKKLEAFNQKVKQNLTQTKPDTDRQLADLSD